MISKKKMSTRRSLFGVSELLSQENKICNVNNTHLSKAYLQEP